MELKTLGLHSVHSSLSLYALKCSEMPSSNDPVCRDKIPPPDAGTGMGASEPRVRDRWVHRIFERPD